MPDRELETKECSPTELKFVEGLALGMKHNQACQFAGIERSTGSRMKKKPHVRAMLEELKAEAREQFNISRDDVIKGLSDAIQDAKLLADPTAQISGWREIGKMLGYYAPEEKKLILTAGQQRLRDQLEDMSEEDLLQLADTSAIDGEFEVIDE